VYLYQNFNDIVFLKLTALLFNLSEKEFLDVCKEKLLLSDKAFKFMKEVRKSTIEILNLPTDFTKLNIFWYKYKEVAVYGFIIALSINKNIEDYLKNLQKHYFENYLGKIVDKPLLSGSQIMKLLNLQPSKKVGEIKEKLILAQLSGKVKTQEEAINYIKTLE
jgi:poly(A) polymerase